MRKIKPKVAAKKPRKPTGGKPSKRPASKPSTRPVARGKKALKGKRPASRPGRTAAVRAPKAVKPPAPPVARKKRAVAGKPSVRPAGKLRGKRAKPLRRRVIKKAPTGPPPVVAVGDVVRLLSGARDLIGRYDPLLARTAPGYREIKGIVCAIREIASGKLVAKTKGSLTAYVLEILHDLTFDGQFSSAQNIGGARGMAEAPKSPSWQRVRGLVKETAGRGSEMRPAARLLENEDFRRSLDGWRVAKVKAEFVAVER